jgi:ubiquitin carboxyl-terminal hydrolase 16/45
MAKANGLQPAPVADATEAADMKVSSSSVPPLAKQASSLPDVTGKGVQRLGKNDVSLTTCLKAYTDPELLIGDNKYGCSNCARLFMAKGASSAADIEVTVEEGSEPDEPAIDAKETESMMSGGEEEGVEDDAATAAPLNFTIKQNAKKQLRVVELPSILCIHFKRFTQTMSGGRKVSKHIPFPLRLQRSDFADQREFQPTENCVYSLFGVVVHSGSLNGGHYIAYTNKSHRITATTTTTTTTAVSSNEVDTEKAAEQERKHAGDNWFYFSDSSSHKVSVDTVLRAQAYLLFYEKE